MNVKPISILCITLGGERQQRIQELFASTTFKITFIDGIPQRQLRSKKGLLAGGIYVCSHLAAPKDCAKVSRTRTVSAEKVVGSTWRSSSVLRSH